MYNLIVNFHNLKFLHCTKLLSGTIETKIKAAPSVLRYNFSMISFSDSHIIVSGGGGEGKMIAQKVEIYDIKKDSWTFGP